jgi:hypothetical protein
MTFDVTGTIAGVVQLETSECCPQSMNCQYSASSFTVMVECLGCLFTVVKSILQYL